MERARLRFLVVDDNPGSRDVVYPIPSLGLLEERPSVSGRREKTQRGELQCQVEDDTSEGLVVRTTTNNIFTSLGRCDDRLTAGVCTFRVIDRGKRQAHRRERHPEFHLDCAYVGRATEDRDLWMCGFSKGQWLIARDKECEIAQRCVNVDKLVNETITSNVQVLMVVESDQEGKFDQETSITDVKNAFTGELRSVGGSNNVSKESPRSACAANAVIEKSVREMQNTVRTIVAHNEWMYFDLDCEDRGTHGRQISVRCC